MPTKEEVEDLLANSTTENIPANEDEPRDTRITTANGGYIDIAITGYMNKDKLIYSIDGRLVGTSTEALPGGIYIKAEGGKVTKFIGLYAKKRHEMLYNQLR